MTSFGWKRKTGNKMVKSTTKAFGADVDDSEDEAFASGQVDWLCFASNKHPRVLEDAICKSERLKQEGEKLAEDKRYWQAIKKWDAALQLTPNDYRLMEMKAQAYLALNELYPALQAAEKTVEMNPLWWIAHQTLGRARISLGEVRMAIKSFSRAIHINPDNRELWKDDLMWATDLLRKKCLMDKQTLRTLADESSNKISEIVDEQDSSNTDTLQTCENRTDPENCTETAKRRCLDSTTDVATSQEMFKFSSFNSVKTLKQLPVNYVCMRD